MQPLKEMHSGELNLEILANFTLQVFLLLICLLAEPIWTKILANLEIDSLKLNILSGNMGWI